MTIATFDYDETRVCGSCHTNDLIHYNLFVMHGRAYFMDDPDCAAWCERCEQECSLIDVNDIKREEEIESWQHL
jgi:hypothetical protein